MKCYSCNRTICEKEMVSEGECTAHDEHIIPAAIGGHLTSRSILCKECGNKQNKNSDSGFTALFTPFIEMLRSTKKLRSFDHKSNDSLKVFGILKQNGELPTKIKYQDGKVMPLCPFFKVDEEKKIIHLYGDKNGIKNARKKAEKEFFSNGKDVKNYKEEIHLDMSDAGVWGLVFSEDVNDFNVYFKSGMLKIAIEYALDNNINPEMINIALRGNERGGYDFNNHDSLVIPFFPLTKADIWYEDCIDNLDKHYPFHAIRLFNCDRELYCYVELFSTFKFFVLLGDNYYGDTVDVSYAEPLLREDIPYTAGNLERLDIKDLVLFFKEEKLDCRNWIKVVNAKNRSKALMELLEKRPKNFNYLQSIIRIYNSYYQRELNDFLSSFSEIKVNSIKIEDTIMENYLGSDLVEKGYLRKAYRTNDGMIPFPIKCGEYYAENPDDVKKYTCASVDKFRQFIHNSIYSQ